MSNESLKRIKTLTPREREVLALYASGMTAKEIAKELEISPNTAANHRANIARKLGTKNIAEMTRVAIRGRVIKP